MRGHCPGLRSAPSGLQHLTARSRLPRQQIYESFDRIEHRPLIACKEPVIVAVKLDELRTFDPARHIAAGRDPYRLVVPTMQHQCRHGNLRQKLPHVGVAKRLEHRRDAAGTGGRAQ